MDDVPLGSEPDQAKWGAGTLPPNASFCGMSGDTIESPEVLRSAETSPAATAPSPHGPIISDSESDSEEYEDIPVNPPTIKQAHVISDSELASEAALASLSVTGDQKRIMSASERIMLASAAAANIHASPVRGPVISDSESDSEEYEDIPVNPLSNKQPPVISDSELTPEAGASVAGGQKEMLSASERIMLASGAAANSRASPARGAVISDSESDSEEYEDIPVTPQTDKQAPVISDSDSDGEYDDLPVNPPRNPSVPDAGVDAAEGSTASAVVSGPATPETKPSPAAVDAVALDSGTESGTPPSTPGASAGAITPNARPSPAALDSITLTSSGESATPQSTPRASPHTGASTRTPSLERRPVGPGGLSAAFDAASDAASSTTGSSIDVGDIPIVEDLSLSSPVDPHDAQRREKTSDDEGRDAIPHVYGIDHCDRCERTGKRVRDLETHVQALESALRARALLKDAQRVRGAVASDTAVLRDEVDSLRLTVDFLFRKLQKYEVNPRDRPDVH